MSPVFSSQAKLQCNTVVTTKMAFIGHYKKKNSNGYIGHIISSTNEYNI